MRPGTATFLTFFASLHVVVLAAPAVVLAGAAEKGGLPGAYGIDLVVASGIIGAIHAVIVWRRLWHELGGGVSFRRTCISALDALVVLAMLSTGLLFLVLGGFAPQHAAMVNQGWPVLLLWIGVQLAAVALAELTRVGVLRWLSSDPSARHWHAPDSHRVRRARSEPEGSHA